MVCENSPSASQEHRQDDVEDWAIHSISSSARPSSNFNVSDRARGSGREGQNFDNMQITADKGFNAA
jgi:hypothetical protein